MERRLGQARRSLGRGETKMNQNKTGSKDTKNQELFITRIFDAPRERVWKAWTEPDLMKRWWGPKAFTSPYCKIDLRVGGKFLLLHAVARGQGLLEHGYLSRNRSLREDRLHQFICG